MRRGERWQDERWQDGNPDGNGAASETAGMYMTDQIHEDSEEGEEEMDEHPTLQSAPADAAAAGMYMTPQAWDSQGVTWSSQGAAMSFKTPPVPGGSTEGGSKKNLLAKSSPARQGSRGGSKKNTAGSRAKSEGPATTYAPC